MELFDPDATIGSKDNSSPPSSINSSLNLSDIALSVIPGSINLIISSKVLSAI